MKKWEEGWPFPAQLNAFATESESFRVVNRLWQPAMEAAVRDTQTEELLQP